MGVQGGWGAGIVTKAKMYTIFSVQIHRYYVNACTFLIGYTQMQVRSRNTYHSFTSSPTLKSNVSKDMFTQFVRVVMLVDKNSYKDRAVLYKLENHGDCQPVQVGGNKSTAVFVRTKGSFHRM